MKIERIDNVLEGTGVKRQQSESGGIVYFELGSRLITCDEAVRKLARVDAGNRETHYIRPKGKYGQGDGKTWGEAFDGPQDPSLAPSE